MKCQNDSRFVAITTYAVIPITWNVLSSFLLHESTACANTIVGRSSLVCMHLCLSNKICLYARRWAKWSINNSCIKWIAVSFSYRWYTRHCIQWNVLYFFFVLPKEINASVIRIQFFLSPSLQLCKCWMFFVDSSSVFNWQKIKFLELTTERYYCKRVSQEKKRIKPVRKNEMSMYLMMLMRMCLKNVLIKK